MTGQLGLRERKKLKAMRHIQEVALDLFDQHGYLNVTIERIAAEAEVSPSSIYRYFGTKEQIILYDEYDPAALRALDDELAARDPIAALRAVIRDLVREMIAADEELVRRRMRYVMTEPAVRAGTTRQMQEFEDFVRHTLAKHTQRDSDDLEIRVIATAVIGCLMSAMAYWHDTNFQEPLHEVLNTTLDVMSRGLRLD